MTPEQMRRAMAYRGLSGGLMGLGGGLMEAAYGQPAGLTRGMQAFGQAFDPMNAMKAQYMMAQMADMEARRKKAVAQQDALGRITAAMRGASVSGPGPGARGYAPMAGTGARSFGDLAKDPSLMADIMTAAPNMAMQGMLSQAFKPSLEEEAAKAEALAAATARGKPQGLPAGMMRDEAGNIIPVPGYEDMRARIARAGRPAVTVNTGDTGINYGDPPKDMTWARNPDGTVFTREHTLPSGQMVRQPVAIPIGEGPVEMEQRDIAAKAEARQEQRAAQADIVIDEADTVLSEIDKGGIPVTGFVGIAAAQVPGTRQYDVAQSLLTIKANLGFDRLQQMRDQSPTGGALGQISNFENQTLQAAMGSLDQAQSGQKLARNLRRVREIYEKIIHKGMTEKEANAYMKEIQEDIRPASDMSDDDLLRGLGIK